VIPVTRVANRGTPQSAGVPQTAIEAVDSPGIIEHYREMRGFSPGAVLLICVGMGSAVGCGTVTATHLPDAGAELPDAPVDGMPIDNPVAVTRFDVGYINDIVIVPLNTTSIHTMVLVVNKGTLPLHLETASVLTFSDDNTSFGWTFQKRTPSTTALDPDRAGGALSPNTRAVIVDMGYVTERIDDINLDFEMDFTGPNLASGAVDNAQAVIRIDSVDAVLKFKITTVASGNSPVYNSGKRVTSQ
jgi:hypothetical protein